MKMICAALLALLGSSVADPNIWPLPQSYSNGTATATVSPTFAFKAAGTPSADLQAAMARYTELIFSHRVSATGGIASASVTVANDAADLQLGVDESYTLDVSTSEIVITAKTQFGAYYAMETLSQLIVFNYDLQVYEVRDAPWKIVDAPRFGHRELLVDTSRHFQPVAELKRIITSMTYTKINTMHWHIVDSQAFPYISPTYPKLAEGAWSVQERYTQNDVADVVEYARQRGVRIVIEVDTPGHASSWCKGHPEVCPSTSCVTPLNPATNATFDLIAGLFKDLSVAGHDNFVHIGGDEVTTTCWTETPSVAAWLKEKNFTTTDAFEYFTQRVVSSVFALGKQIIAYQDLWDKFGTKLDKRVVIHQWRRNSTTVGPATEAGYKVVWMPENHLYLDYLPLTWDLMYAEEPCAAINDTQCGLVIGGGAAMWGETADASDVAQTVWPRLGAVAERMWSARAVNDTKKALPRLHHFRCLLTQRGIAAAPVLNAQARSAPSGPGSCYAQ